MLSNQTVTWYQRRLFQTVVEILTNTFLPNFINNPVQPCLWDVINTFQMQLHSVQWLVFFSWICQACVSYVWTYLDVVSVCWCWQEASHCRILDVVDDDDDGIVVDMVEPDLWGRTEQLYVNFHRTGRCTTWSTTTNHCTSVLTLTLTWWHWLYYCHCKTLCWPPVEVWSCWVSVTDWWNRSLYTWTLTVQVYTCTVVIREGQYVTSEEDCIMRYHLLTNNNAVTLQRSALPHFPVCRVLLTSKNWLFSSIIIILWIIMNSCFTRFIFLLMRC